MAQRWWIAAGAAFWIAAVAVIAPLAVAAIDQDRPPLWDMAKNGRQAAQISLDLRRLDLVSLLFDLNRHDPWPFTYSLLLQPVLLAAGPSLSSATVAQAWLFTLLPLAVLWAARQVDRSRTGLAAAAPAAFLTITSPLLRLQGVLLLREVAGALLTLVALALYLRARRLRSAWAWRCSCLSALALLFTKYNYGLLVLAAAVVDQRLRGEPPPPRRVLLQTLVVPLALWFVIPRPAHLRGFFDFLGNRSSDLGLGAGLVFYPRSFATEYVSGHGLVGTAILALAVAGAALLWRRGEPAARSLALLAVLGAGLAVLHPYKQARFLATVVPLLLLLAGFAVARVARRPALQALAAALLCLPASGAARDGPHLVEMYRWHSADGRLREALEFVRSAAPASGRFTTVGGFNELSPDSIAWAVITTPGSRAEPQPPLPRGDLDLRLRRRDLDWMVTVQVEDGSPFAASDDFRAHTAWQQPLLAELAQRGWRTVQSRRIDELAIEIEIRRRDGV